MAAADTVITPPPLRKRGARASGDALRPLNSRFRGNNGRGEPPTAAEIREAIRGEALAMGFDAVGFAAAHLADHARTDLREYIERGYHGDMRWLADTAGRRGDPQTLWHEARTVVVLGL